MARERMAECCVRAIRPYLRADAAGGGEAAGLRSLHGSDTGPHLLSESSTRSLAFLPGVSHPQSNETLTVVVSPSRHRQGSYLCRLLGQFVAWNKKIGITSCLQPLQYEALPPEPA